MSHKIRSSNFEIPEGVPFSAADAERFWAKVRRMGPDDCWPWLASCWSSGYGQFRIQCPGAAGTQQTWGAHRAAFSLTHGPIPDGADVLHRCDNRLCCNPAHLFPGDHLANMQDAAAKGRLHVPRPKRQSVSDEDVERMVALVRAGRPRYVVADMFGVSKAYVGMLANGTRRQYRPATALRRVG